MKVTTGTVKRYYITELDRIDPITCYVENYQPGKGKIIIECFGQSWSSFWGAMGTGDLQEFFVSANSDYLVTNLSNALHSTKKVSYEDWTPYAKKEVVRLRREDPYEMSAEKARGLYDRLDGEPLYDHCDLLLSIYGGEWWYDWPQERNEDYYYLERVVEAVQEAFKETKVSVQLPDYLDSIKSALTLP